MTSDDVILTYYRFLLIVCLSQFEAAGLGSRP